MNWTRSETLSLAAPHCAFCHGLGLRDTRDKISDPCHCVLREVFRTCYKHFRHCITQDPYLAHCRLEHVIGATNNYNWGLKDQEYVADFCLLTRRALNDADYRLFKYHFLLGADWRLCCRKLKIDKGVFFHHVYRIEAKLGRAYRETEPYGLFPVYDYTDGPKKVVVRPTPQVFKIRPIRPPMRPQQGLATHLKKIA